MINLFNMISRQLVLIVSLVTLTACQTSLPERPTSGRHIEAPARTIDSSSIPEVVRPAPVLPPPTARSAPELYTVIVQDTPVRELLFVIARDTATNIDVHPNVTGNVSINAVDQTLPQIIERINRQVDFRWHFDQDATLVIEPDTPFLRTYRLDYVNVSREANTGLNIATSIVQVGGTSSQQSGGSNNSTASISQSSSNNFWTTIEANILSLLGESANSGSGEGEDGSSSISTSVTVNPESGLISVNASARQHRDIAAFIESVSSRSLTQVLIEATVVEVSLNDDNQSGVDWAAISRDSGQIDFIQSLTGINMSDPPASMLTIDRTGTPDAIAATIRMLSEFGDLRVLSSPKIMALNNQAAMLRVVDNRVYFSIEVEPGTPATATTPGTAALYTSQVQTVPVGFVMSVTPQIGDNDQVTLNVRPTISRIVRFVNDPNPALAEAGVTNAVPEIQIREIESILKVFSGQVAVLGGLMQDSLESNSAGLPVASRLPGIRNLFSYRREQASKTELIVFIRPVVIRQPSLDAELQEYRQFLPTSGLPISNHFDIQPLPQATGQR
ncbi:type II secretion system protein GspD [Pseudohongiella spirulinae]|uniref:MSHA-type pilus biogenesis protein MshL n=1 Tax=Pseudohongiella spirulinae TaxID=1249552 RepID=A0A0S2KAJ0_9GAMM|nr:type II secretion system protein GspD [Pseudohongiella spirulinae]ALO45376.1 MSHA-type pilus biogenesis protein MshL [Pseudohongiella spirulinae]